MRDFSVEELQAFLRENKVKFETEPSPEQLEAVGKEKGADDEGAGDEGEEGGDGGQANAGEGKGGCSCPPL